MTKLWESRIIGQVLKLLFAGCEIVGLRTWYCKYRQNFVKFAVKYICDLYFSFASRYRRRVG